MLYGQQAEAEKGDSRYQWEYSAPDGKNGYYITAPKVTVWNRSEEEILFCRIERADGTLYEEYISPFQNECRISAEAFGEGRNTLSILEESGEVLVKQIFDVEYQMPEVYCEMEKRIGEWYQDHAMIHVRAEQSVSEIREVRCYQGDQMVKRIEGAEGVFEVAEGSQEGKPVVYHVTVEDAAGHTSEASGQVYIDRQAPVLTAKGIPVGKITNQTAEIALSVCEENRLAGCSIWVEQEHPDGTRSQLSVPDWEMEGRKAEVTFSCKTSGIYRVIWEASDAAGRKSKRELQFTVDKEAPVIQGLDKLQDQQLASFTWEKEKVEQDFTKVETTYYLDGLPYQAGETVEKEGRHIFQIRAKDAAGNESEQMAEFYIVNREETEPGRQEIRLHHNGTAGEAGENGGRIEENMNIPQKKRVFSGKELLLFVLAVLAAGVWLFRKNRKREDAG
ncbi:MAG TPA: hypothetical protein DCZ20_03195 [Lachnospiraceae bacterium]|nr:hypothetical protein [Lachnospiraceae bacterium]